jgi:hypothetical protein
MGQMNPTVCISRITRCESCGYAKVANAGKLPMFMSASHFLLFFLFHVFLLMSSALDLQPLSTGYWRPPTTRQQFDFASAGKRRAGLSRLFFFHRLKDVTVPLIKSILSGFLEKEEKSIFSLDRRERPTGHNCPSVNECLKWGWGIFRPQLQTDHASRLPNSETRNGAKYKSETASCAHISGCFTFNLMSHNGRRVFVGATWWIGTHTQ